MLKWGLLAKNNVPLEGEWPVAELPDGRIAVRIISHSSYTEERAISGRHQALQIMVANYQVMRQKCFTWDLVPRKHRTLEEVKAFAERYVTTHPQLFAVGMRRTK